MKIADFYEQLEFILELEPKTITGEESLKDLDGWDSLAMLSFIAMGDAELDTIVSAKALMDCRTVTDLAKLFDGKIAG